MYEVLEAIAENGDAVTYVLEPWDHRFLVRSVMEYEDVPATPLPERAEPAPRRASPAPSRAPKGASYLARIPKVPRMLAAGGLTAILFGWFPLVRIFQDGISLLVHELGHTAMSLFFGRFAVPAVILTITFEQTWLSVICVWLLLGLLTWYVRSYTALRNVMLGVLVLYPFVARSGLHDSLITVAGHWAEIGCAAWFFSKVFDEEGPKDWERTVYSFLGWFLWVRNAVMFGRLIFDQDYKDFYYTFSTTGGDNDLVKITKTYGVSLESVSFVMLAITIAVPALVLYMGWRGRTNAKPPGE